jgi:F-type H+-transporting ATPase subunit gamma
MAQTRILQRRVRSVKNAKQITKALEVVAASRMRRIVSVVEGSRLYGELAAQMMQRIGGSPEAKLTPYFTLPTDQPVLYLIFTSDRGQAGAFNSNVFNLALNDFRQDAGRPKVIVFGRKGSRFFARLNEVELLAAYEDLADNPEVNVFASALEMVQQGLSEGQFSKVMVIYTQFMSSLNQKTTNFQLFPAEAAEAEVKPETVKVYEFEPDITEVLEETVRLYLEARLMQARIESAASEHAMRMIAMGNANRNASDLIDDLTLELNATRQAAITQEIAEITGGAAAIAA